MLKGGCINPDIMRVLSRCGHGDKVLIADGNYPLYSKTGESEKVCLALTPGTPTVTQVLEALCSAVPFEKAEVMLPGDGSTPEIFREFKEILDGMELSGFGRFEFYDQCCLPNVKLAILTGEKRVCANLLLTVGVVPPC